MGTVVLQKHIDAALKADACGVETSWLGGDAGQIPQADLIWFENACPRLARAASTEVPLWAQAWSGDGYGSGDGSGSGSGYGYGDGTIVSCIGDREVRLVLPWGLVIVGCQIHNVEYWRKHWRGIADENSVTVSASEADAILDKCSSMLKDAT